MSFDPLDPFDLVTLREAAVVIRLAACAVRRHQGVHPYWAGTIAFLVALSFAVSGALANERGKYPDITGAWARTGRGGNTAAWDPTKPAGLGQQAPLTPEYQAVLESALAERSSGGQQYNPAINCLPAGMPRIMVAYDPLEIIVTAEVTYVRSDHLPETRRIYTDGRDWPRTIPPTFAGYSIGRWVSTAGDGRYQALEVESRGMKGPRALDVNGLPLHRDNQTIVRERIFLDPANHDRLHDEITVIDHAYTEPWTVMRDYARETNPMWVENNCSAENHYVVVGNETYFISADGHLLPTRKDQPPPRLNGFDRSGK
jgi:hypothetical protein